MKHTPEPWKLSKDYYFDRFIHGSYGETRIVTGVGSQHEANANRIVACVNALHDMDSKEIDEIRAWAHGSGIGMALAMKDKAIGEYQLLVSDMEKQRDELLEAMLSVRGILETYPDKMLCNGEADAIIAFCKLIDTAGK